MVRLPGLIMELLPATGYHHGLLDGPIASGHPASERDRLQGHFVGRHLRLAFGIEQCGASFVRVDVTPEFRFLAKLSSAYERHRQEEPMSMPEFTADAALYNPGKSYQMAGSPEQFVGPVQPAQSYVFGGGSQTAQIDKPWLSGRPRQCICVQWEQQCFLNYITRRYVCLAPRCKYRICNY